MMKTLQIVFPSSLLSPGSTGVLQLWGVPGQPPPPYSVWDASVTPLCLQHFISFTFLLSVHFSYNSLLRITWNDTFFLCNMLVHQPQSNSVLSVSVSDFTYVHAKHTVVMYGCESWTIKKAEHQRLDAFELREDSRESLGLQEDPTCPS